MTPSGSSSRARRARHARETLGLDVRELPLEGFQRGHQRRLAGRVRRRRARRRARAPRRPGRRDRPLRARCCGPAACCASSRPIPRRVTARLAGARWWGYLPAHTVLLPRRTLRELISARGLVISEDVPFVRTFAAQALGRRAGRAARARSSGPLSAAAERHAAVRAQPLARRRARDPRPPHAGPLTPLEPLLQQHQRPRAGARRPARLQRAVRTIPDVVSRDARRRRRPRAADRRRVARRDLGRRVRTTASTCSATPPTAATAPARRPATCARCKDGAEVIVMVHADNQYDPGLVAEMAAPILRRRGRHRDRLAAARRPRDRGRDAALEVARQPAADRDREPRLRRALLGVPHRLPRVLGRLPALDPVPAQLRRLRLRPGDLRPDARARRARGRDPDPDALLPRGVVGRLRDEPALRAQDLAGARRASGSTAAGRCCAVPPHGSLRTADSRGRSCSPRWRSASPSCWRRRTTQLVHDAIDYDHHAASIAQGHGFATSYGRPTAFRPPAYPIFVAGVYKVVGTDSKPDRVRWARLANALVGTGIVALIGLIALQLWGRRRRSWRSRWARSTSR